MRLSKISQKSHQQPHEAGAIFQLGKQAWGGKQSTLGHPTSRQIGVEDSRLCHCACIHLWVSKLSPYFIFYICLFFCLNGLFVYFYWSIDAYNVVLVSADKSPLVTSVISDSCAISWMAAHQALPSMGFMQARVPEWGCSLLSSIIDTGQRIPPVHSWLCTPRIQGWKPAPWPLSWAGIRGREPFPFSRASSRPRDGTQVSVLSPR